MLGPQGRALDPLRPNLRDSTHSRPPFRTPEDTRPFRPRYSQAHFERLRARQIRDLRVCKRHQVSPRSCTFLVGAEWPLYRKQLRLNKGQTVPATGRASSGLVASWLFSVSPGLRSRLRTSDP